MNPIRMFLSKQFAVFLIVGTINTLFGDGLMFLLYNVCGCSYWLSSAMNYVVGGIISYFLNKFFTFKTKYTSFTQIILFIVGIAVCYLVSYFISIKLVYFLFSSCSTKVIENISLFLGMGIYTVLNFLYQKLVVFRVKEDEAHE